jgi:hypothetical protein
VRRTFTLLIILMLATVPLACGGDELSPEAAVAEAGTKTANAGSARIDMNAGLTGSGDSFTMVGKGEFADERGHMTFDVSAGGQQVSMEMVFDRLVIYMRFPPELGVDLPRGKSWVKMDLEELGEEAGIDLSQLMQAGQSDPTQALQYLRGASDDFEKVGDEEIRGVETTHYRGTVDLRKAAAELSESVRESIDRIIELTGESTVPFDVWVDDEGLARRIKYEQPLPGSNGETATMAITMDFYDFGIDVDVTPPEADEVIDIQELIGQGG